MLVINVIFILIGIVKATNDTLIMTHLIFRHGHRTPESMMSIDPFFNSTFFPYGGQGQLTLKGKKCMLNLGKLLKKRYSSFLGQYDPNKIEALSGCYARNRVSLQLVLNGLFPPENKNFGDAVNWQPIDFDYIIRKDDRIISPVNCKALTLLSHIDEITDGYEDLYNYLTINTGIKINSKNHVLYIYDAIFCQNDMGLQVPQWIKQVWPEPLSHVANLYFTMLINNKDVLSCAVGNFLKKIIEDTQLNQRKLFLYSAHDINLACLLGALDVFDEIHPNYGSYISFEIHKIGSENFIKVLYENYLESEPVVVNVKGCGKMCNFNRFAELMARYFPEEWCPLKKILTDGYYLSPKPKDYKIINKTKT